ncbi:IS21 family transposase [Shewanella sedimentimangrovi]|uniref:IS21 family transposase n=2 Tax=Shewanella sedimentimangrovi TaxID=2814293 RepID=A0ABX7R7Q9_9GAMM|nr:IS21 family transposase [Shewanella sedimentimangrovi]
MTIELIREVLRLLLNTRYSNHHIARMVKVAPNTVRRYRRLLKSSLLDWQAIDVMPNDVLDQTFNKCRTISPNKRLPDWAYVHKLMQQKHQTLMQLWEEYRRLEPDTAYCFSQYTYYYRQFVAHIDLAMRQTHHAGEKVYVDYAGRTIPWIDIATGKEHQAQIFIGVLGCSQYTFGCACKSQKLEDFLEAHNRMFSFFNGVPQIIVPDNLKSAVTKPGVEPLVNRSYLELCRYYGCFVEPARVRRPKDKPLAEIGVLLFTRWVTVILRRRQFFSVEEINQAITELLQQLNLRPFKRLPGCRQQRFEEMDKPQLKPLPVKPFEIARWVASQKVPSDYHIYVYQHAYSVPYQYVGEKVEARVTRSAVEILHNNKRIATHIRQEQIGGHTTLDIHRPESHRAYAQQSAEQFRHWAVKIGECAGLLISAQFAGKPEHSTSAYRACSQLQALAKLYGHERFELACRCAIEIHSKTVKSVRSILQCKLDQKLKETRPVQSQLPLHHPNLRGAGYYQGGQ